MMFARSPAAQQYSAVNVESKVLAANPHRLITLLFDGAIEALKQATDHMRGGREELKQRMARKAVSIIAEGLRACLNAEHGGDIAANLHALYDYLARRIFDASRTNDEAGYAEAITLLGELRSTWVEIDPDLHGSALRSADNSSPALTGAALTRTFAMA